ELQSCQDTFASIEWEADSLANAAFSCPKCSSNLVAQIDSANTFVGDIQAKCRACGAEIDAESAVEQTLQKYFELENYIAFKDSGDQLLHRCPECGVNAYITTDDEEGCAWCKSSLSEKCARCHERLTPQNVAFDNHELCGYCDHVMSKDD